MVIRIAKMFNKIGEWSCFAEIRLKHKLDIARFVFSAKFAAEFEILIFLEQSQI